MPVLVCHLRRAIQDEEIVGWHRAQETRRGVSRVLVVDASVVVDLLARFRPQPIEDLLFAKGTVLVAPELLGIEVLSALRKLARSGAIPESRASDLPLLLRALRIRTYPHDALLDGIWALRQNVTADDAAYLCLARVLDATLVTRDARLAQSPNLSVPILIP